MKQKTKLGIDFFFLFLFLSVFASFFSPAEATETTTITVGDKPNNIDITPDGKYAYVSQSTYNLETQESAGEVLAIETATNTLEKKITVEAYPHEIAVTPDGKFVCIASVGKEQFGFVSIINTDTYRVTKVDVGYCPRGIAVTPNSQYACVTNLGTDDDFKPINPINSSVSVVNLITNTVSATLEVPAGSIPFAVAITPDGEYAYVTYGGSGAVSAINITRYTEATAIQLVSPQLLVVVLLVFVVTALLVVILVKRRSGKRNPSKTGLGNLIQPNQAVNQADNLLFASGGKHYRHT